MSKQLLIVNVDNAAANFAQARAGQLGIVEDGAIVAALTGNAEAQFTVRSQTTSPFNANEVVRAIKVPSSAGQAGTGTADFTNAEAGEDLYVKLINTTLGTADDAVKAFFGATLNEIRDAINADGADPSSQFEGFSASVGGNILTVTAPINSTFRLAATVGASIAYPQKPLPSVGQAADIAALEEKTLVYEGAANQVGHPVIRPASQVEAGATYTQYVYEIARQVPNKAGTGTVGVENYTLILAVNSTCTNLILALDGDAIDEEEGAPAV